ESIQSFCEENDMTCKYYKPKEATKEAYLASVEKAVKNEAGIIVMAGSSFETTVYDAQTVYPDVNFLLIDGVPHDDANNYTTAANTVGVIFAEEEAGYLAGYAAVKEGYKRLGFMGGQELPSVKRYGYGYVQGAAAAAAELETKIEMRYVYTGTFEASKDVRKLAASWYTAEKNGTEVIFACGGAMGQSVIKAAEKNSGKVIGVDTDQSTDSDVVITTAEKGIAAAVDSILGNYARGKFTGGLAFNYAAKNDGISLEMENSRFGKFKEDEYKKVLRQLRKGKIELKKDTSVGSVAELTGDWVTIVE
ncbi:MAG: BMP family ABC transporter substrate-binding protein, partial [Bacillota bacterium]|nr:BMP family ABC transporter substrate-binding protein [Bacillota bacterium]